MGEHVKDHIARLGRQAKAALPVLATATTAQKNQALIEAAGALRESMAALLTANAADVDAVIGRKNDAFIDRLKLTEARIEAMASGLEQIAELLDPVGRELAETQRPNGLRIVRVAVPIGVIGMIYESRPNVGADASALCLKSGNAVILRGGSESRLSTQIIVECMQAGLQKAGLPVHAVQTVATTDRAAVAELMQATDYLDLIIPRGGRGLVELVRDRARVPTLFHLDGNCHSYIHADADVEKSVAVIRNAKLRRTGVCGSTESIVIDKAIAEAAIPQLVAAMPDCEIRGDDQARAIAPAIGIATEEDWGTEYLDSIVSVRVVDDFDAAIDHIRTYSSAHTDAILTENDQVAAEFLNTIDSAIVIHNASTQFADGGEFGMGAEIGIATGKMHARGPVGLEQLTSFKYKVFGSGQIRP